MTPFVFYGAWRENAKELFEAEDKKEAEFGEGEGLQDFDEEIMPITTDHYLYLSGTPFRAIASGEEMGSSLLLTLERRNGVKSALDSCGIKC